MELKRLIPAAALLLVLAACGGAPAPAPSEALLPAETAPASAPTPAPEPSASPEPVAAPEPVPTAAPTPEPYDFGRPVPESAAVDPSWFDDAVFVGDSVTVRLSVYCASTGALSEAAFLAAPNWCSANAFVEDEIAAAGAKKIYVMLGINDMAYGMERVVERMGELLRRYLEKSPDAAIFVESVTPMTRNSGRMDETLNNGLIREYNAKMLSLCAENGWYFVDVAEPCYDGDGYLKDALCGDADGMGIHFSTEGAEVWVEYLKTHVPEALKTAEEGEEG